MTPSCKPEDLSSRATAAGSVATRATVAPKTAGVDDLNSSHRASLAHGDVELALGAVEQHEEGLGAEVVAGAQNRARLARSGVLDQLGDVVGRLLAVGEAVRDDVEGAVATKQAATDGW